MEASFANGAKELLDAQAQVWKYTFNYVTSMSLRCALELGIPDAIANHDKPLTLSELVKALSIPHNKSPHLYRLMRIVVHSDFFAVQNVVQDEEGYVLTSASKLFLKNNTKTLSPFTLMMTGPVISTPFSFFSAWFRSKTDSTPLETAYGTSAWSYFEQHSDANRDFNEAMASDAKLVARTVEEELHPKLEGFETLVDVGGGTGIMAKAISQASPHLTCIVFDLPHVISDMQSSKNLKFVSGNMFKSVPPADIILLKWILHDWSDEECVEILQRCKDAISSKYKRRGKVIIIDIVIDLEKGTHESTEIQLCFDILMMALVTGKERTEAEWKKLFLKAGFTSYKITQSLGLRSIIEVFP